jgi:hypothetical protein
MKCIIFCIWVSAFIAPDYVQAQKNVLTERKVNALQKDYKKILIIGDGPIEARIFLDELSDELIRHLSFDHIKAQYLFKGNDTLRAGVPINAFQAGDFDAIIFFFPKDSLHYFDIHYSQRYNFLSGFVDAPHYRTYKQSVTFEETFGIQLFESDQRNISIWEATLKVDCDFGKKNRISVISNMIMSNLKKNKIF